MTPTARTLTLLRRRGYLADVCERWLPRVNVRKDLFGCIDLAAIHRDERGVLGVQATTVSNLSARLAKARALPALHLWLAAGNAFQVWGWCKRGRRWQVKIIRVSAGDLAGVVLEAPRRRRAVRQYEAEPLFDCDGER